MKPYFAKYLPVEGESKFVRTIYDTIYSTEGVPMDKIKEKVKLFLCSRDIRIGDNYTCPHKGKGIDVGFGQPEQVEVWMTYTKERNLCPDCFKVIGEISPEAIWVKEGDEFDISDIKDEDNDRKNYNELFKLIKGPCGHFH